MRESSFYGKKTKQLQFLYLYNEDVKMKKINKNRKKKKNYCKVIALKYGTKKQSNWFIGPREMCREIKNNDSK